VTLLVAATESELCGHPGLVCGVGPVEAAAATARALALHPPRAVLHVGLAGAHGLAPGTLVVGAEAVYVDISAAIPVVSRAAPDPELLAALRTALPAAQALPIATTAAVGGTRVPGTEGARHRVPGTEAPVGGTRVPGTEGARHPARHRVEAMEGFAVLRACALAGVPAVELRAISNELGEEDRARWEIPRALEALADALPRVLSALPE
jgi:futalosine hydrolase